MKKLIIILSLMFMGCSSISLVENWKNPDIVIFNANKVLIVGMAQNNDTREDFETKLQKEFTGRDVEAWRSIDIFDLSLTDSRKTDKELDDVEQSLLDKDFDAILLTKIIGSENRENFVKSISRWDDHQSRFNDDYLEHQGIYYDDNYYDQYTIYHAETTLYCICEGKERAMIWRGIIEITEPNNIDKAIKDYVKMIIVAMEDQDLVFTSQVE
ncbi:hypothetical protein [uncultured Maribacter sp.]|uniref:hypothetical protein n=1 Tax=uncultured Maribacter sp. TaxID=431308 RepID=UPI002638BD29|nr:hypothetical protein [uncultured Maribacter sp.]